MALFEFKKGQHYHGMWRAWFEGGDFLAFMWRENGQWIFRYRFRYFKDQKVFESEDTRSAYQVIMPDEPGNRIKMFNGVTKMLNMASELGKCGGLVFYPCDGDEVAMMKIMANVEGIHMKRLSKDEAEEYFRTNKLPKGV